MGRPGLLGGMARPPAWPVARPGEAGGHVWRRQASQTRPRHDGSLLLSLRWRLAGWRLAPYCGRGACVRRRVLARPMRRPTGLSLSAPPPLCVTPSSLLPPACVCIHPAIRAACRSGRPAKTRALLPAKTRAPSSRQDASPPSRQDALSPRRSSARPSSRAACPRGGTVYSGGERARARGRGDTPPRGVFHLCV